MTSNDSIVRTSHDLIDKDYHVFLTNPETRVPYIAGWNRSAITDHGFMDDQWDRHPNGLLCISTGPSNLLAIDCDNKHGKNGTKALIELEAKYGPLPPTVMTRTPNNGFHHLYVGASPNSASTIAPGIDVRSVGGFIIVPPSAGYLWDGPSLIEADPVKAPGWFVDLARKTGSQSSKEANLDGADNSPILKGTRNDTLFKLGCALRALGYGEDFILMGIREANARRCEEPLGDPELREIAHSACKYPPGTWRPNHEPTKDDGNPVVMRSMRDIVMGPTLEREFLIDGLIPVGWSGSVFGPGGIGKSHMLNEQAICLALGIDFYDFKVPKPRRVGLISPEMDRVEFQLRFKALYEQRYSKAPFEMPWATFVKALDNIFVLTMEDFKKIDSKDIVEDNDFFIAHMLDNNLDLLTLDTLSRVHSADENNNSDMSKVMNAVKRVSDITGRTVQISTHVSKMGRAHGSNSTARGASAIRDGLQWSYALEPHPKAQPNQIEIICLRHDKANFSAMARPVWLQRGESGILHQITKAEADALVEDNSKTPSKDLEGQAKAMNFFHGHWKLGYFPTATELERAGIGLGRQRAEGLIETLRKKRNLIVVPRHEYHKNNSAGKIVLPASPENLEQWAHHVPPTEPENQEANY